MQAYSDDWRRQLRTDSKVRRFLRFFFHHLYTTLAWAYDFVAWSTSMGQWWTWQKAAVEALPSGRLLELGYGTGRLLADLLAQGRPIIGVDTSAQMVHISRRRLHAAGLPVAIVRARASALPFRTAAFGGLLATFPSEFILEAETLREAWRVLEAGGRFIVVPMARITGSGLHDRFAAWLYRITGQSGHIRHGAWAQPFEQIGFTAEVDLVRQQRAIVVRLVARKPETAPPFAHPEPAA